jgi:SAM-dependent methyltransferase
VLVTEDLLGFVLGNLPAVPARALEVGAGTGELAAELRDAGYDVLAIDPASDSDGVVAVALAELDAEEGSFDAALAVVSLHHVEPLAASLRRLAEVVRPGGRLVVDEFDVDRFDERAAAWWSEQRLALGHEDHQHDARSRVADLRSELHSIDAIRASLEPFFELTPVTRVAYLHRWGLDESLADPEIDLIRRGELPAVGVRFAGVRSERAA